MKGNLCYEETLHRQPDRRQVAASRCSIGKGKTVPEVCREIEVSQQTYYRWRQKYGGMSPEMIKELRELQKENARLKKVVADQALDNQILKEAIHTSKKF